MVEVRVGRVRDGRDWTDVPEPVRLRAELPAEAGLCTCSGLLASEATRDLEAAMNESRVRAGVPGSMNEGESEPE